MFAQCLHNDFFFWSKATASDYYMYAMQLHIFPHILDLTVSLNSLQSIQTVPVIQAKKPGFDWIRLVQHPKEKGQRRGRS